MKRFLQVGILTAIVFGCTVSELHAQGAKPLFDESFSSAKPGEVPESFMVLDGQFAVREEEGNRFLELPGAPLESFGVLFGPNEAEGVEVTARILGTKSGRKFPTFAVGLNGVGGYKVRVAPAKNALELVKGDDIKASVPFKWASGQWTRFRLSVRKSGSGVRIAAKAWQGEEEPKEPLLQHDESEKLPPGKAGVWGMPFSGTPIRFDDLKITAAP
jgi:hypothetical protein